MTLTLFIEQNIFLRSFVFSSTVNSEIFAMFLLMRKLRSDQDHNIKPRVCIFMHFIRKVIVYDDISPICIFLTKTITIIQPHNFVGGLGFDLKNAKISEFTVPYLKHNFTFLVFSVVPFINNKCVYIRGEITPINQNKNNDV